MSFVRLGGFNCHWEFTNYYFCGARACTTREYAVEGSDVRLVREYLEWPGTVATTSTPTQSPYLKPFMDIRSPRWGSKVENKKARRPEPAGV